MVDFPASLGPRTIFRPGLSSTSRSSWRRTSCRRRWVMFIGARSSWQRHSLRVVEQQYAQPEGLAQLGRALGVAARLVVDDPRPEVARERAEDGVGRRER